MSKEKKMKEMPGKPRTIFIKRRPDEVEALSKSKASFDKRAMEIARKHGVNVSTVKRVWYSIFDMIDTFQLSNTDMGEMTEEEFKALGPSDFIVTGCFTYMTSYPKIQYIYKKRKERAEESKLYQGEEKVEEALRVREEQAEKLRGLKLKRAEETAALVKEAKKERRKNRNKKKDKNG